MNKSVFVLALAGFVVGTVELVVAGILGMISDDLGVSLGEAGLLVTVYSFVFAFGSPVLVALTARFERRRLLTLCMMVFCAGSLLAASSPSFLALLASRVVLAASCSLIVVLAIGSAAGVVPPEQRGRAIGIVFSGLIASLVLGVPIGTMAAAQWGWRMTFVLIAALTLVIAVSIRCLLPRIEGRAAAPLAGQLKSLRDVKIVTAHLASVLQMTGQFTLYAYVTPFLSQTMHLSTPAISAVLLVYGVGGIFGGWLGGWSADRFGEQRTFLIALTLHAVALAALPAATASMVTLLVLVVLWCVFNMAPSPAIQKYIIAQSPGTAEFQISINTSALHLGVALGSLTGGVLVNHVPAVANAWVGAAIVFLSAATGWASVTRSGAAPSASRLSPAVEAGPRSSSLPASRTVVR